MPDENRVFDVSKPSKVSPPPTSRPIIVGHHPMNDPMVREEKPDIPAPAPATKIQVSDGSPGESSTTVEQAMAERDAAAGSVHEEPADQGAPAIFDEHDSPENLPLAEPEPAHESVGEGPFTAVEPDHQAQPQSELPPPAPPQSPHIEGLHINEPRPKKGRLKWIVTGLVILLVAVYLAIDAGLFGSGVNLPFHIFKQKPQTTATPSQPAPKPAAVNTPSLPAGYKKYKLADTNIFFAAPAAWGDPASTTDPGYAQRGGTNQPAGNYAYLVNFATNKDVQIAVTSNKYLPAIRTPLYYDYLQWCQGTNDNKLYQSVLNFSTANKVDTPTTVTCDQGPLTSANVLSNSTIILPKDTDANGKVIGDVYTMNLKDPVLVVFRVKDAAMTNGPDIKQLLDTVQLVSAPSASTFGQ